MRCRQANGAPGRGPGRRGNRASRSGRGLLCVAVVVAVLRSPGVCAETATETQTGTPSPAPAVTPVPPEGFGKAKLGMSVAEVQAHYPDLAPATGPTRAAYFRAPELKRYLLPVTAVPGLQSECKIELRFWKDRLWGVIIDYRKNRFADVRALLRQQYGPPTLDGREPTWIFPATTIMAVPLQGWYAIEDNEITKEVQRRFVEAAQRQRTRQAMRKTPPPPTPTPPPAQR